MAVDSEPIIISSNKGDFVSAVVDISSHVQYKFLILMMITYIMLSSDVFINRVLSQFNHAVDYKCPTSWGVCIQSLVLALIMLMIDGMIRQKII